MTHNFLEWMEEFSRPRTFWYAKRLTANDTGLTGGHQSGPLITKEFLFQIFPSLDRRQDKVPETRFKMWVDSNREQYNDARAKWYWSKGEGRFTRIGGKSESFLNPENTGAIAIFVFLANSDNEYSECHSWICGDEGNDEFAFEEAFGPLEAKRFFSWKPGEIAREGGIFSGKALTRRLVQVGLPKQWSAKLPTGIEIVEWICSMESRNKHPFDKRILERRDSEFILYKTLEEAHFLETIKLGFTSIELFLKTAQSILQSRKSRSGNSLEYHIRKIFIESGLVENIDFSYNPTIEVNKKPDFIFPSKASYLDQGFKKERLTMLGVKTTCKDRWRQILNEADRIEVKHLLTLQQGLSQAQFDEMKRANVRLVVPSPLHDSYPPDIRSQLLSVDGFIKHVESLRG